jgi:hypothetical protein
MSNTAIIERVQKLLALSKSCNANEAAAAAAIANRLIDQHRLSEADLETTSEEELEPIEEDIDYIYQSGKVTPWKKLLVSVLAKHYGCAHWNDCTWASGRKVSRYRLVGKRSDIGIARYMYTWLSLECQRLADLEAKGKGRVFVGSYCQGFVQGVATQLAASRAEAQKDATSAAIVKIDARLEQSKEEMYRLHTNLKTIKDKSAAFIDPLAFHQGKKQGTNLHLGATMAASGGTKLLGS